MPLTGHWLRSGRLNPAAPPWREYLNEKTSGADHTGRCSITADQDSPPVRRIPTAADQPVIGVQPSAMTGSVRQLAQAIALKR
jgi:hypothetical protein